MAAYGLYTHIQSNKRRSIALLIGLFFLVYVMVFAGALLAEALTARPIYSGGYYYSPPLDYLIRAAEFDFIKAAPFATVGTVIWIFIAYQFHQQMIDAVTGARPVSRAEEPRLYNLLENLCISRGITMPTLRIADDEALNAFATGLNPKQYSITVTRGLIEALNDSEIESVLGHELTHIRNGDVLFKIRGEQRVHHDSCPRAQRRYGGELAAQFFRKRAVGCAADTVHECPASEYADDAFLRFKAFVHVKRRPDAPLFVFSHTHIVVKVVAPLGTPESPFHSGRSPGNTH